MKRFVSLMVVLALVVAPAWAQFDTGSVVGTIRVTVYGTFFT